MLNDFKELVDACVVEHREDISAVHTKKPSQKVVLRAIAALTALEERNTANTKNALANDFERTVKQYRNEWQSGANPEDLLASLLSYMVGVAAGLRVRDEEI